MRSTYKYFAILISLVCIFIRLQAQSDRPIYLILTSNPTGTLLAGVGTQGVAHLLNTETRQIILDMSLSNTTSIWSVDWSSDNTMLAFADVAGNIYIYCTDENDKPTCSFGEKLYFWHTGLPDVLDIDWHPDGELLSVASQDNLFSISIWQVETQQRIGYVSGLGPVDIDWSSDGQWLAFANVDLGVGYIDTNTINNDGSHPTIYLFGSIRDATAIAWNNSGTQIAIAEGSIVYPEEIPISINLWDIELGQSIATLSYHKSTIEGLSWSHDDKYLASVGFDAEIVIWDANNISIVNQYDALEHNFTTIFGITWIGDSHQIAFGSKPDVQPSIINIFENH